MYVPSTSLEPFNTNRYLRKVLDQGILLKVYNQTSSSDAGKHGKLLHARLKSCFERRAEYFQRLTADQGYNPLGLLTDVTVRLNINTDLNGYTLDTMELKDINCNNLLVNHNSAINKGYNDASTEEMGANSCRDVETAIWITSLTCGDADLRTGDISGHLETNRRSLRHGLDPTTKSIQWKDTLLDCYNRPYDENIPLANSVNKSTANDNITDVSELWKNSDKSRNSINHAVLECLLCPCLFFFLFPFCLPAVVLTILSDKALERFDVSKARTLAKLSSVFYVLGLLVALAFYGFISHTVAG